MVTFPNAKINLGLEILRKRSDGFHDIDSVFYPIPLRDALEAVPDPNRREDRWHYSGLEIPGRYGDNLIIRALELLRKEATIPPLNVFLHKAIPMGAGLGGGSSDAAFFLKLASSFAEEPLSKERLKEIAAALGSDCAFFIEAEPAHATGRGEILKPVDLDLSGVKLILVCPDVHVSTSEAYGSIMPKEIGKSTADLVKSPMKEWRNVLRNRFEESVFRLYPELDDIKQMLYDSGAIYASMTGSGSAVYGLFENWPDEADFSAQGKVFRFEL